MQSPQFTDLHAVLNNYKLLSRILTTPPEKRSGHKQFMAALGIKHIEPLSKIAIKLEAPTGDAFVHHRNGKGPLLYLPEVLWGLPLPDVVRGYFPLQANIPTTWR